MEKYNTKAFKPKLNKLEFNQRYKKLSLVFFCPEKNNI